MADRTRSSPSSCWQGRPDAAWARRVFLTGWHALAGGGQFALKTRPRSLAQMSYEELLADHFIIASNSR